MASLLLHIPILLAIAGVAIATFRIVAPQSKRFGNWRSLPFYVPAATAFGVALLIEFFPNVFGAFYYPGYCISWPQGGQYVCSQEKWLASGRYEWAILDNLIFGIILLFGYPLVRFLFKSFSLWFVTRKNNTST